MPGWWYQHGGGECGRGLTEQGNRGALTFMGVACILHANSKCLKQEQQLLVF